MKKARLERAFFIGTDTKEVAFVRPDKVRYFEMVRESRAVEA
jgi:hypothetical protein